ncbi:Hachiman antiphage defense system protein HamA [Acidovorax sp. Root219]|uniref:Hachiman antiphage defense system protein HamA n=1 Tax=Acidovorax sp. Root219 TaxID=1736493 RepID=UPI00070FE64C|nr:Hachiman antiphage defense system protein HamA [Acidovorax sp. Root219]
MPPKRKIKHVAWLKLQPALQTASGDQVEVYELQIDTNNKLMLKAWAKHFREHYCLDDHIDELMSGTPQKTRAEYLIAQKFPDANSNFGPQTRAGDFAEILLSDVVESLLGYWVPRTRYRDKKVKNESAKGTDVVGIKFHSGGPSKPSAYDALITVETKAHLSKSTKGNRLQDAVDDAQKDDVLGQFRVAESLNAMKQRFIEQGKGKETKSVARFQHPHKNPYIQDIGASALFCTTFYKDTEVAQVSTSKHRPGSRFKLIVVHGQDMMKFVHELYDRAANEA